MKDCCGNGRANIVPKDLFSFVALKKVDSLTTNHQIANVTTHGLKEVKFYNSTGFSFVI